MKLSHFVFTIGLSLFLSACSGSATRFFEDKKYRDPKNCVEIEDSEMDDFKIVSFDTNNCSSYLEGNPNIYAFPRAVIDKKSNKVTYQIYVFVHGQEWHFLHSYRYLFKGKLEPEKKLSQIDRTVRAGIQEHYTFSLSRDRFEFFSEEPLKIRVYGERGNSTVEVSPELFRAVLSASDSSRAPQK
ncbi:MAG: hypothetical protein AB7K68_12725 [Bacteriovoracia bacterium]